MLSIKLKTYRMLAKTKKDLHSTMLSIKSISGIAEDITGSNLHSTMLSIK